MAPTNDAWSHGSQPTVTALLYPHIRNSRSTTLINSLPSRTTIRPIAASRHGSVVPIATLVLALSEAAAVPGGRQGAFPIKLLETLRTVLRWTWTCPWLEFAIYVFIIAPSIAASSHLPLILFLKRNLLAGIFFVDTNVDDEPVY